VSACDPCLRRALLVAVLAARIAALLDRPRKRVGGLLALPEPELAAVAAGDRAEVVLEQLDARDLADDRERCARAGVAPLCRHSGEYPPALRELADAPAVLFVAGRSEALAALRDEPPVAIVGTRSPTPYGTEVAYALGRGLGVARLPVVSGLALGIDATAHRGCLDGGGLAVAVLACGPDLAYPRRHRGLHARVRAEGAVVSELPPGMRPFRWSFPARNRIMAGLSRMTIVVEAASPSGSLITTEFAKDLGRSVGAVPGRVTSRVARGTNELLRDGAVPITGPGDVLDELYGVGVRRTPPGADARPEEQGSEPHEPWLRDVLAAAERHDSVAAIAAESALTTARARAALTRLEAGGHLVRGELGGWERPLRSTYPGGP
jgi:DNA processing protein